MIKKVDQEKIKKMDWQNVRDVLKSPKSRSTEQVSDEKVLRRYFGDSRFEELRDLSLRSDKIRERYGNVVLLPGIMGSHLSVTDKSGDEDHIWINFWRLVLGGMNQLQLNPDGKTNVNGKKVDPDGLIKWYYALALETFQAVPFPYDWRLNICDTADNLADFIRKNFNGEKVHFVAHSMGGLVVRNFIRQHNDLWNDIKGHLVMLGTPNAGSFAAVQGLMGRDSSIKKLALFDVCQDTKQLVQVISSFRGLYQMCPGDAAAPQIYQKKFWAKIFDEEFETHLKPTIDFHKNLVDAKDITINPKRMAYIAGVGYKTPSALKLLENNEYDFVYTSNGDGTVSHELGLLKDVPTYYIKEAHGDLPNNRRVLKAAGDILQFGSTEELPTQKPDVSRARSVVDELEIDFKLEQIGAVANQVRGKKGDPEDALVLKAEKTLFRTIIGARDKIGNELQLQSSGEERDVEPIELELKLVFGDITKVEEPVLVVGKYQNLPTGGASGAVDRKISNLIQYIDSNSLISMELGQLFFIPTTNRKNSKLKKGVESVIVAGMGQSGSFSREDLRYLMMNITMGVVSQNYDSFATVAIGASIDSFTIERAVRSIWQGISDAVGRFHYKKKKLTLTIAEFDWSRQQQMLSLLDKYKIDRDQKDQNEKTKDSNDAEEIIEFPFENLRVKIHVKPQKFRPSYYKSTYPRKTKITSRLAQTVTRMDIKRFLGEEDEKTKSLKSGKFKVSAFTSNAAIPVREISVNDKILDSLIEKLRYANGSENQEKYGKLLHSILVHEDFQSVIDTEKALTLVLNREASQIPWEMICYGGTGRTSNFGVDLRVTRQFSSDRARVPSAAPPVNKQFKALIIADPAPEPELQLAGARREGFQLSELFTEIQADLKGKIDLRFQALIGYDQCDIVDILSLIFNEDLDLIHFAGHGIFDATNPSNTGWVFGKDTILSAHEIFRLRRVPRLVFANACFSAGLHSSRQIENLNLSTTESNRNLAGLAEAFFQQGIENYIGSGWQVDDKHAVAFAETFYEQTLKEKQTLGSALGEARRRISAQYEKKPIPPNKKIMPPDTTWGAYQHYGNAYSKLVGNGQ